MKDSADLATIDIFSAKRRGRPTTGKAKSNAQRMREYRQRKNVDQEKAAKAAETEITLSIHQFEEMAKTINRLTQERDDALQQLKSTCLNPEQMTDDERQLCSKIIADFRRPKNKSLHGLYQSIIKECSRNGVSDATLIEIETLYIYAGSIL